MSWGLEVKGMEGKGVRNNYFAISISVGKSGDRLN